jgi:hypothetical protein
VAVTALAVPAARADVTCSVVEIEASSASAPSIDPDLKAFEKKFKRPPMSSWNVFKKLGGTSLSLAPQQVGAATLVHGKLGLLLRDVITREGKKPRFSLGLTVDDAAGKRVVDTKVGVDAGDYVIPARPLPGDKGHLIAISCR